LKGPDAPNPGKTKRLSALPFHKRGINENHAREWVNYCGASEIASARSGTGLGSWLMNANCQRAAKAGGGPGDGVRMNISARAARSKAFFEPLAVVLCEKKD
jgi:hypothetical protein